MPTGLQVVLLQSPTLTAQGTPTIQAPTSSGIFTLTATGSGDAALVNVTTANEYAFSTATAGGPTLLALFLTVQLIDSANPGMSDPALTVSGVQPNAGGTKLTFQVQIAPNTQPRSRVIRVLTPNGENSLTGAPTFSVVPQR